MTVGFGAGMLRRMGRQTLVTMLARAAREQALTKFNAMDREQRRALIDYVPESVRHAVSSQIDNAIIDTKISESDEVQMMLDPDQGLTSTMFRPHFDLF